MTSGQWMFVVWAAAVVATGVPQLLWIVPVAHRCRRSVGGWLAFAVGWTACSTLCGLAWIPVVVVFGLLNHFLRLEAAAPRAGLVPPQFEEAIHRSAALAICTTLVAVTAAYVPTILLTMAGRGFTPRARER